MEALELKLMEAETCLKKHAEEDRLCQRWNPLEPPLIELHHVA